jgi:hypothetical protein
MTPARFRAIVRSAAHVALASSCGASVYACSSGTASTTGDAGADVTTGDPPLGGDDAFADEASYACAPPLPNMLDGLTPVMPVDHVELREQDVGDAVDGGTTYSAPRTVATHGQPCAGATDRPACQAALAAITLEGAAWNEGWYTDGDNAIGRGAGGPYAKQLGIYTRGDTVGVLRTTAEMRAFLGSVESLEEARLLLVTMNQPLVCTTTPARSGWRKNDDGSFELLIAGVECGTFIKYRVRYHVGRDGTVTQVARDPSLAGNRAVCGRAPEGLARPAHDASSGDAVTAHLVLSAYLEAASVVAFRRLELELRRLNAPASLVARAQRARADEIGHARDLAALARRSGGVVPPLAIARGTVRSVLDIALENAVEGCVRETYGALVAAFQAERCAPGLRPLLRRIAIDEARHAELAHDVARWLDRRLAAHERAAVASARAGALAELREAVAQEPDAELVRTHGVPGAAAAVALLAGVEGVLRAAA